MIRWFLLIMAAVLGTPWRRWRKSRIAYPAAASLIVPLPDDAHDGGERFLDVAHVVNFRDIGGYRTADGRTVRRGRVYRSGKLDVMNADGRATLGTMGVKLVCDLRSEKESEAAPYVLPADVARHALPVHMESDHREQLRAILFNTAKLRNILSNAYREMIIDDNPSIFATIINYVADADNLPMLIHCTAGKDRTGVATALILSLLGVPEQTIIADYTLSNHHYDDYHAFTVNAIGRFRLLGIEADDLWPLLVAEADTMRAALDHIRTRYGSVESYVRDYAGVPQANIDALRANLLE
ncbi:MAG: tyrosine-protein phosphatase [Anaerolineaceae bacterium]|nr:MAG: tyrosine-protein phosphatase [Anaerolineaceae bacterium]